MAGDRHVAFGPYLQDVGATLGAPPLLQFSTGGFVGSAKGGGCPTLEVALPWSFAVPMKPPVRNSSSSDSPSVAPTSCRRCTSPSRRICPDPPNSSSSLTAVRNLTTNSCQWGRRQAGGRGPRSGRDTPQEHDFLPSSTRDVALGLSLFTEQNRSARRPTLDHHDRANDKSISTKSRPPMAWTMGDVREVVVEDILVAFCVHFHR